MGLEEQVRALDEGRGFVDRSADRLLFVSGADARRWLNDLVTGSVAGLAVGRAIRSLLLTPTGRIRADFLLSLTDDGRFLMVQARDQEAAVGDILAPYVLSSAVVLSDAAGTVARWFPGTGRLEVVSSAPVDPGALRISPEALERWSIRRGHARMGVDFQAGSLPAESGLDDALDLTKGCFLGQESVAKVRNMGHPPTVLRHLRSAAEAAPGGSVHTHDHPVGVVTSVAPDRGGGSVLLARVDWAAAETDLVSADGIPLLPVPD